MFFIIFNLKILSLRKIWILIWKKSIKFIINFLRKISRLLSIFLRRKRKRRRNWEERHRIVFNGGDLPIKLNKLKSTNYQLLPRVFQLKTWLESNRWSLITEWVNLITSNVVFLSNRSKLFSTLTRRKIFWKQM